MTRRRIFKIVLLGDNGVGKATFRMRFLGQGFRKSYGKVIGANFAVKKIENFLDEVIIAQIWEIIPQDRFRYLREMYYKGSTGGILLFDISRKETLHHLFHWIKEFKQYNGDLHVPLLIVGSKADLRESSRDTVNRKEVEMIIEKISKEIGFPIPYVETSIQTNDEIDHAFRIFVDTITNYLLFSDRLVEEEIQRFIEEHGARLKNDMERIKKEHEAAPIQEYTAFIEPQLMNKLSQVASAVNLEVSLLINKILSDFFKS